MKRMWAVRGRAPPERRRAACERRWRITFAFGLVHGFGFACVLRELHLPPSGLATSLVAFNGGDELGQLAIVLAAYPALRVLRGTRTFVPSGVRVSSSALAAFGVFLLAQRAMAAS